MLQYGQMVNCVFATEKFPNLQTMIRHCVSCSAYNKVSASMSDCNLSAHVKSWCPTICSRFSGSLVRCGASLVNLSTKQRTLKTLNCGQNFLRFDIRKRFLPVADMWQLNVDVFLVDIEECLNVVFEQRDVVLDRNRFTKLHFTVVPPILQQECQW